MVNNYIAVNVTGTEFELEANRRVFDVVVYKPDELQYSGGLKVTVTANSFSQASDAAVEKANQLRALYLEQNHFDSSDVPPPSLWGRTEYTPADVRSVEVVRTHVYHFRHKDAATA